LENLCGALIMLIMALFFSANLVSYDSGPLWMFQDFSKIWPKYLSFIMLEFGLYALLIYPYVHSTNRQERLTFWLLAGTLTLVPFYCMGLYNDFAMRASIPALFLLQIFVARFFIHYQGFLFKAVMLALLIIGAQTPTRELARALTHRNPVSHYTHVVEIPNTAVAVQYLGDPDSLFFKYAARKGDASVVIPQGVMTELQRHESTDG
jgi:cell division protein FtsW (lipid II flippase)